jgi:ABC-type molybdate transport system substrate-binding protein
MTRGLRLLLVLAALAGAAIVGANALRSPGRGPERPAIVFCGGSMRQPVETLLRPLDGRVLLDYGGSETLMPRILAGAEADILVTHDPFPEQVRAAGRLADLIEVGDLAPTLCVRRDGPLPAATLGSLAASGLRVGLPDPRHSTCGAFIEERLRAEGLTAAVAARTVVQRRSHQELANDLRVGAIDVAVVWNFVAAQNAESLASVPLPGPWPRVRVAICRITGSPSPAADAAWSALTGSEAQQVFSAAGYR